MTRAEWRRQQAGAQVETTASVVDAPVVEAQNEASPAVETPIVDATAQAAVIATVLACAGGNGDVTAQVPTLPLRRRARTIATPGDSVPAPAAQELAHDEPVLEPVVVPATFAGQSECSVDEFERAARLFSFTGEVPVRAAASAPTEFVPAVHLAPRRRISGRAIAGRITAASFSIGVMGVVGLLAFGTAGPAALAASSASTDIRAVGTAATEEEADIQAYVTASDTEALALNRTDTYNVASLADLAAEAGVTQFANTWVNNPNADVQWPFEVGVPISAAYGSSSYLATFASAHNGVDFTPGAGAEIHAIADGTVRIATEAGGDYGVNVMIDHVIDGEIVSTRYAHMQYGSLNVAPGDTVSVGDVLGTVGATGKATGAHLHFEVLLGGTTRVDPMAWMFEHAGS